MRSEVEFIARGLLFSSQSSEKVSMELKKEYALKIWYFGITRVAILSLFGLVHIDAGGGTTSRPKNPDTEVISKIMETNPFGSKTDKKHIKILPVSDLFRQSIVFRTDEEITNAFRYHNPRLNLIFNKYLDSGVTDGVIYFEMEIDFSGKITGLKKLRSSTGHEAFDQKIQTFIQSWRFPKVEGNTSERFWFPIVLLNYLP